MAILDEPRVQITVRGIQGSQITESVLYYHTTQTGVARSAKQCAEWFITAFQVKWLLATSAAWTWLEVEAFAWNGVLFEVWIEPVGAAGSVVGDALPVYNSMALRKNPDNATIEPPGQPSFRDGRVALAGVPESFQDNNILTPAALLLYNDLASDLVSYDINALLYAAHMLRFPNTLTVPNPLTAVKLLSMGTRKLGTQNTRK